MLVRRTEMDGWLPLADVVVMDDSAQPRPVIPADTPIPISYARANTLNFNHAGFMLRGGAFVVDLIVLVLMVNGFELLAVLMELDISAIEDAGSVLLILGLWLYYALMESSPKRGSIGKLMVGICVVDMRGDRISFGRATGRFFAKYLSALPLYMGFLAIGWSDRKQGYHDMIAGTLVLRK